MKPWVALETGLANLVHTVSYTRLLPTRLWSGPTCTVRMEPAASAEERMGGLQK